MKNNEFTQCPMCGGRLEQRTTLEHPTKGTLHDVPHHECTFCGEIFLSGEAFDIVHACGRGEKASA